MKRPKTPLPCPAPVPPRSLRFPEDHLYEKWGSVVLQPPNVADWDGAFVSSTSRLVLPVDEIEYEVDGKPMKKEFPGDSLSHKIEDLVLNAVRANSQELA